MNFRRAMLVLAFLVTAGMSAGCGTVSTKEPLYTEKDKVEDAALEGIWKPVMHNARLLDKMEVTKDGKGRYSILPAADAKRQEGGKSPEIVTEAVIFRLGPHFIMEMGFYGFDSDKEKKHDGRMFGKIALIDGRMFVTMPNGAQFQAQKGKPEILKVEVTDAGAGVPGGQVVLTDTTEKMRAFLLSCGTGAFLFPVEAYRRPEKEKVAESKFLQTKEQESFEVMWLIRTHLREIAKQGAEESWETALQPVIDEGEEAEEYDGIQLLPKLELKEAACEVEVGKLYKELRAELLKVKKFAKDLPKRERRVLPAATMGGNGAEAVLPNKEELEKRAARHYAALVDPLKFLAEELPKDHAERAALEELSAKLKEVSAEMEKKMKFKFEGGY